MKKSSGYDVATVSLSKDGNDDFSKIKSITFSVRGFSYCGDTYLFDCSDGKLFASHTHSPIPLMSQELCDITEARAEFIEKLCDLHISEWKHEYIDDSISDGIQWELTAEFDGTAVTYYGSNAYPQNFDKLLELLKIADRRTAL